MWSVRSKENYSNKYKRGIYNIHKLLAEYQTKLWTNRWPFFYNILHVAALVAFIIYVKSIPALKTSTSRRGLHSFSEQLVKPEINNSVKNKGVAKIFSTRNAIEALYRKSLSVRGIADENMTERNSTGRIKVKRTCAQNVGQPENLAHCAKSYCVPLIQQYLIKL